MSIHRRRTAVALLGAAAAVAAATAVPSAASGGAAAPLRWASAAAATVHPGISVTLATVTCRVGAVLTSGADAYLAIPASCTGTSGGSATNGCRESQLPVGFHVAVPGARYPATLAYSSFVEMQLRSDTDTSRCADNSLSLLRLDRRDIARTNPSIPSYGGPTGTSAAAPAVGAADDVLLASPTAATALGSDDGGWAAGLVAQASVVATDRGAPVLDSAGREVGMVTLVPQTQAGASYVSSLAEEIAYLRATALPGARLATGTAAFTG